MELQREPEAVMSWDRSSCVIAVAFCVLSSAGCWPVAGEEGPPLDAGQETSSDAAPPTLPHDAGMDVPLRRDAGSDAPLPLDGGPSPCAPLAWPAPAQSELATCSSALDACLAAGNPPDTCFAGQDPACRECLKDADWSCATSNGCDDEYGALSCCLEEECAVLSEGCAQLALEGRCAGALETFRACADAVRSTGSAACARANVACWTEIPPRLCFGTAEAGGRVGRWEPHARWSFASAIGGLLRITLTDEPWSELGEDDHIVLLELLPTRGVLYYPASSGSTACTVFQLRGGSWSRVVTLDCDIAFDQLDLASAADVCDGHISGSFLGQYGIDRAWGSFDAPFAVAASQIAFRSCLPTDAPCSRGSECCSGDCAPAIGGFC
jgi:hypothetical protein